jgi:copper chaperone
MHTLKFKTNIKCDACIQKVTPSLNGLKKIENWKVDVSHTDKILSIETEEALNPKEVIMLLDQVGYHAEKI